MKSTLYCKNETSDKVYDLEVTTRNGLYQVSFAYGRRGGTLTYGTKTGWVSKGKAEDVFNHLIREKRAKGYTFGLPLTALPLTAVPAPPPPESLSETLGYTTPPFLPQLLNPITAAEAESHIRSMEYCAQEKFDGKRIILRKENGMVVSTNRKGISCGLSSVVIAAMQASFPDCVLDGESIGDKYHAFDLLSLKGKDLRSDQYRVRLVHMMNLWPATGGSIMMVETAIKEANKQALLKKLLARNAEGIVFKRLNAPYTAGRPNSGGDQFKRKFYETLSAVVNAVNSKRSVEVKLLGDEWQIAGNVTIPPNCPIPRPGKVVEIRYLYAFPESGILYQPVYLGERTDISVSECVASQLKFKPKEPEPEISEADMAAFLGVRRR